MPAQTPTSRQDAAAKPQKPGGPQIPAHKELLKTDSGLGYAILKPGKADGKQARFGDRVKVHVTVWLENGKLLESTRDGGRPPVQQMVGVQMLPGLAAGLMLVREGGRIKLVVPPELAFGKTGGPKTGFGREPVPPDSTMIYDVEVFEVERLKKTVPGFTRVAAEKEKPLADGMRYSILKPGKDEKPPATDILELRFALFNVNGQLLECSEMPGRRNLKLTQDQGTKLLKFLQQALPILRVGGRYRFFVPPKLCYGDEPRGPLLPANSDTIWELELVRTITPLPVPPFAMPPLEKTTRTRSGLRYEVIKAGEGKSPSATDKVEVHYAGWHTNGKLFDASYSRGETTAFPLDEVIPGWTEGLQLMKEGAVYKFTVPADLAYGLDGNPRAGIGPNETLIFHVELIRVLK